MQRLANFDVLVLDARLRQALVTVRSLGRRGLRVAALDTIDGAAAFYSQWCRERFVCPAPLATDEYVAYLEEVLRCTGVPVVVAAHDGTIGRLRAHRLRIERRARLALGHDAALRTAIDKERTLAVARRQKINVPRTALVSTVADVPAAVANVGLPAVVKPTESWLSSESGAAWIGPCAVATAAEACAAVERIKRLNGAALVQQLLTGRREAVSLFYAKGKVYARFAQWAPRTNPPLGGESVLRQSIAVPEDIGPQAERLVREIDLEGYSEVEFRRDSGGVPYLMEINPRLSASVEIAVRSGVDFPRLIYQWASGSPIDCVVGYRIGRWMRYLQGDVTATIETLQERGRPGVPPALRTVVNFGASFLRPMAYDYFDWRDPAPAIREMYCFAFDLGCRSLRKIVRRAAVDGRSRVACSN